MAEHSPVSLRLQDLLSTSSDHPPQRMVRSHPRTLTIKKIWIGTYSLPHTLTMLSLPSLAIISIISKANLTILDRPYPHHPTPPAPFLPTKAPLTLPQTLSPFTPTQASWSRATTPPDEVNSPFSLEQIHPSGVNMSLLFPSVFVFTGALCTFCATYDDFNL